MPSSPAATLAVIVALIDKLAANQPRNLDLAHLRFLLHGLKQEQPKPRKRNWAEIKRRQRARRRQLIAAAAQEAVKGTPVRGQATPASSVAMLITRRQNRARPLGLMARPAAAPAVVP